MKTISKSTLALAMITGLYIGGASANDLHATSTYAKHQGFLHDVRQAQLHHVAEQESRVAGARHRTRESQRFGNEGGVLRDIWQAQYTDFVGHSDQELTAEGHTLVSPRNFLTDVRRSQFRDSDV